MVIVAAHPDDETIGAGAQLGGIRDATVIHVTDGAPRSHADWQRYKETRRSELLEAMAIAGIAEDRCLELGIPDQEASHRLVEITDRLSELFAKLKPDVIVTHPYEGGHPDHDATAFAVHHAAAGREVWEFCSYHRASSGSGIETGCFLGWPEIQATCVVLDGEQRARKARMRRCFVSQAETLQWFRETAIERECFRRAPDYDFTVAPHSGRLFYEFFNWGMSGEEWRQLAAEAMAEMAHV